MKIREFLTPEWVWRALVAGILLATLWLKSNYVTIETYAADRKEQLVQVGVDKREYTESVRTLNITLNDVKMAIELQKQTGVMLTDHEVRIRTLERVAAKATP